MNLAEKLSDARFTSDVVPLLAPGVPWDPVEAGDSMQDVLLPLLLGEPWRQKPSGP